ncbi:diguanylate cyclase [Pseudooceanicola sediminis]|uniref:dihydroneopterin aldolase n=1 Tax=Pseudooceanicola sediminis TaxID=2211117 RepID=A0A399IXS1_9RHOB|nr:dihydroneopterin aldolase [Pseudooceanicola sediminis]KAA2313112.1 diguanylate cyclase [Puniceibacterium sp. HSS470]RII37760.1 diguanylate cyclase [Pseudooceanicola sediminis]|tara:strand:+ start:53490 stop:54470 length:981 start_codon:yes stop_codon:yes gene_type:complete
MSDHITQAFDHPLARSKALSGDAPADRISLRDHLAEVEIGAFQAERGIMQRLRFNIVVEVRHAHATLADDVDRILSYDTLTEAIEAALAAERLNLLETLADHIAALILTEPKALRVFVRIEKLDRGPGALGVEIVRSHDDAQLVPEEAVTHKGPDPLIVFLSDAATRSDLLRGWLDQLQAAALPVILCCGPGSTPRPTSTSALVQRRIDLLAIEQAAWVLAGKDRRCVVVNTRTELDWSMKQGQISLWAPSKIVLDAVGDRPDSIGDGAALALWFAGVMKSTHVLMIGETALDTPPQPTEARSTPAAALNPVVTRVSHEDPQLILP